MKLSVVIPAHNEEGCLPSTVSALAETLRKEKIDFEIVCVNDNSTDSTEIVLKKAQMNVSELRVVNNAPPNGFGHAVRCGLNEARGEAIAVYMADNSDSPDDLVLFYKTMVKDGVDCVFGSRFMRGSKIIDYPLHKLVMNRLANKFIQLLFGLRYNDVTNAFKMYRREVIDGLKPFLSPHFNLTVELPLKAIVRGYSYSIVPNSWTNRKFGVSKLKIKEMGSRYLFIVLYCLIEKWLVAKDYYRKDKKLA